MSKVFSALLFSGALLGDGRAAPSSPPGGHHSTYFGGDNQGGYPPLTPTDATGPTTQGFPAQLAVTVQPNPFLGVTAIRFAVRVGGTRVHLYDMAGRVVHETVHADPTPGWQEISWNGRDQNGLRLAAGVYLYRVESAGEVATGKLVLLR